jgi:hypothetical protein
MQIEVSYVLEHVFPAVMMRCTRTHTRTLIPATLNPPENLAQALSQHVIESMMDTHARTHTHTHTDTHTHTHGDMGECVRVTGGREDGMLA